MKDFFISYNRADGNWAEWIAWQLESAGYTTIIQAWDFRQGDNFVLEMQRATEEARRTLIVLSPDFLASKFTAPEWAAAFARDPTGSEGLLLPVRVRECRPKGLLAQIVYIDLVGASSRDEARERLLDGVSHARAKPAQEPATPPLEPGQAQPEIDEPPWPPAIEGAVRVASGLFWRLTRIFALLIGVALAASFFLGQALPELTASNPTMVYSTAVIWGLAAALVVEAILHVRNRRRRASTHGEGHA